MTRGQQRRTRTAVAMGGLLLATALAAGAIHARFPDRSLGRLELRPGLENKRPDGSLFTPSTQSLLRGHSWLETATSLEISEGAEGRASLTLSNGQDGHYLRLERFPLSYILPRLHYTAARPADAFDAFNLMLAEYSRNGLSIPRGAAGDEMAHYQTSLQQLVPWKLAADYDFRPNPQYMPQRFGVVNNCLAQGLWELTAKDRSGEIYHSWLSLPAEEYISWVSRANALEAAFVGPALGWKEDEVELDLDRLRRTLEVLPRQAIQVMDAEVSYSSQGSRRKLQRDFALVQGEDGYQRPESMSDFLNHPVAMTSFVEPGIYSNQPEKRKHFDFSFLARPKAARVSLVEPHTSYRPRERRRGGDGNLSDYLEIVLELGQGLEIVLGNLPLDLLVKQEDFVLHGFGVGIFSASGLAERRRFLVEVGPRPSYAYLTRREGDSRHGINSHDRGLEQIFLRAHPDANPPHWQITLTSYERIVDLVRYRVSMPEALVARQLRHSREYVPPIYFTYRDDNIN